MYEGWARRSGSCADTFSDLLCLKKEGRKKERKKEGKKKEKKRKNDKFSERTRNTTLLSSFHGIDNYISFHF
jgi:hypothetical protein